MQQFVRHFIHPIAQKQGWKSFCEIGASTGLSTDQLLKLAGASYTIVDPCFDQDLALKYANDARVTVRKSNSLDALPHLDQVYDCILIDGDHNWYTVYNELRLIRERNLLRRGGMIFLHDVGWPYGRRDLYYQPETIPPEFRLEYKTKGIIYGKSDLVESGGKNAALCNAVHEGGPRNGVLTAVEDFVAEHSSDYNFCRVKLQYGLGIIHYRSQNPSQDANFFLLKMKAGIYSLGGIFDRERGKSSTGS